MKSAQRSSRVQIQHVRVNYQRSMRHSSLRKCCHPCSPSASSLCFTYNSESQSPHMVNPQIGSLPYLSVANATCSLASLPARATLIERHWKTVKGVIVKQFTFLALYILRVIHVRYTARSHAFRLRMRVTSKSTRAWVRLALFHTDE